MRSKSEVIIANMLVLEELPFVYEKPLYAPEGKIVKSDVSIAKNYLNEQTLPSQRLRRNLKNIVLFRTDSLCPTLINTSVGTDPEMHHPYAVKFFGIYQLQ